MTYTDTSTQTTGGRKTKKQNNNKSGKSHPKRTKSQKGEKKHIFFFHVFSRTENNTYHTHMRRHGHRQQQNTAIEGWEENKNKIQISIFINRKTKSITPNTIQIPRMENQ